MEAIMKFESLPNEMLIECFQYLNAIDIFYSFYYLNSRFYNLIRHIPLYLNIEHSTKSKLVEFCTDVLSNSEIKQQIISLKLLKKITFDAVETLFSFVSLREFSQLKALTVNRLNENEASQLSATLPLLTNLRYLCCERIDYEIDEIQVSLLSSTIQTLLIFQLPQDLVLAHPFKSLVNVTITYCYVDPLCYFFKYVPRLRYLNIETLSYYHNKNHDQPQPPSDHAVHLKRLVINNVQGKFDGLEMVLNRTPNLKYLMISANSSVDIVDALRWEHLITTSLPLLNVFKFIFRVNHIDNRNNIVDKLRSFETDFWHQQGHWYIEYIFEMYTALIYTLPYMSNEYEMIFNVKMYYDESFNSMNNKFVNVTNLSLCLHRIKDTDEYHFPNVKSLRLCRPGHDGCINSSVLTTKHIHCLGTIVNLWNITHLNISLGLQIILPYDMLQLLKEAPNLSSLEIDKNNLFVMLNNREVCEYLNKMITRLYVTVSTHDILLDYNEILKICAVFFNMKEFQCHVGEADNLEVILNELSKLAYMELFSYTTRYRRAGKRWLEDHNSNLDLYKFTIICKSKVYIDDDDDIYDFNDPVYDFFND